MSYNEYRVVHQEEYFSAASKCIELLRGLDLFLYLSFLLDALLLHLALRHHNFLSDLNMLLLDFLVGLNYRHSSRVIFQGGKYALLCVMCF